MKKFTFKGVLDGFRSSVNAPPVKPDQEIVENLRSEHFQVKKTFRHGFPHQPTALAFDPVQRLLAIGTKSGSLRILGRPGVDAHVKHEGGPAVIQLQFLVNEGALISATADDTLHLWNFRQKIPQVVQSLKFQRESITCIHLPLQSKWLYVGTERGNIHVLHIETFVLSGYVINWNKAIEVSRKTHPGAVIHLSDNPLDLSKMLIGYETGQIVFWDLKTKNADYRCQTDEPLKSISWHHEGKQFMCSHTDGSLSTWALRQVRPTNVTHPHAKTTKDGELEACKPIQKVEWKLSRSGEAYVIFSGGLAYDTTGRTPSITVIQGKTTTVLEMEHNVVDFVTLCESPWSSDFQDPYAVLVLLQNDLVVIDLLTPGFPCYENPYPMDIHESPVTCCVYFADCPSDLVPAFYSVGSKSQKKTGFSEKDWPISGGEWSPNSSSYNEIILTGHADGSIKFWDASAGSLQVLYKLKTAKLFEKSKARSLDSEEDPLAIQLMFLCPESRKLAIAGAGKHVVLFKFKKVESMSEVVTLEVCLSSDVSRDTENSPERAADVTAIPGLEDTKTECSYPLKVKSGLQKRAAGFQATLICLTSGPNGEQPENITALSLNSSYGLMAYGNETGLVIVDIVQKISLLVMSTSDLGSSDPYQRALRSPKRQDEAKRENDDKARSPSIDQIPQNPEADPDGSGSTTATSAGAAADPQLGVDESSDATATAAAAAAATAAADQQQEPGKCAKGHEEDGKKGWKKSFSLKRQLSKVDLKIKNTFTPSSSGSSTLPPSASSQNGQQISSLEHPQQAPARTGGSSSTSSSVFYCNPATTVPPPVAPTTATTTGAASSGELISAPTLSPVESVDSGESSASPDETAEIGNEEELERERDRASQQRPVDLPIFDECLEAKPPVRPKRVSVAAGRKKHQLQLQQQQPRYLKTRENRLLSVPNLRYQKDGGDESGVVSSQSSETTTTTTTTSMTMTMMTSTTSMTSGGAAATTTSTNESSFAGNLIRRFSRIDKLDSSFQRSRSSSMSSLENITTETISCLTFADSYTKKSDGNALPTLWIGTSLGSVQTVVFNAPAPGERHAQPVIVSTCNGSTFKLKGCILTMSFLDCNGALIPYSYESWKDENVEGKDRGKSQGKFGNSRMSPSLNTQGSGADGYEDRQFVVLTSEKQARVVALPSQNCVYRQQLAETHIVIKAEITSLKDSVCLVCYISNGHIATYSLPSLRPLIDVDFLPLADLRIARTLCFSNKGHGLYLSSPTEIQKFSVSSEFCAELTEMMGDLFTGQDMPEPPKESFFKGLFGGGSRSLDREELFGESSGRASRTIAKHIPGPNANTEGLRERVSSATGDVALAHQMVMERGEKLSQLEERTARMMSEAETFSQSAHGLMLKYKDKKWYQL